MDRCIRSRFVGGVRGRVSYILRANSGIKRAILVLLIVLMLPLYTFTPKAEARGFRIRISKVIPFASVVIGWHHRNRVYRSSERFIRDRNQYYDGLRETARHQLLNREIMGLRPSQVAAYTKVVAMIENHRTTELDVAESRKREARSAFHDRLEEAAIYAISGSRLAQELIGSMKDGIGSAQQVLDRLLNKITSGSTDALQDLRRIRKIASDVSFVASAVGGKAGDRLRNASNRIMQAIDRPQQEAQAIIESLQLDLTDLSQTLDSIGQISRVPSAGELREILKARFLPGQEGNASDIGLEAISVMLSQLEVGDGSLKDEARAALREGFVARCAAMTEAYQVHINSLRKANDTPASNEEEGTDCFPLASDKLKEKTQDPSTETQPLPAEPEEEVEVLPVISASGQFSEVLSGPVNTSRPMGVNFQLQANYMTGKINGNLTGGRTTSGNPVECVSNEDPSIVYDTAFVDYTDSYTASFSGTIDPENGDFNLKIVPKGSTTDRLTAPFTVEGCLPLNSQPAPGSSGWTGDGTISGYVTKDGFVDLNTYWTSFGGQIEVAGNWSGAGTVETP